MFGYVYLNWTTKHLKLIICWQINHLRAGCELLSCGGASLVKYAFSSPKHAEPPTFHTKTKSPCIHAEIYFSLKSHEISASVAVFSDIPLEMQSPQRLLQQFGSKMGRKAYKIKFLTREKTYKTGLATVSGRKERSREKIRESAICSWRCSVELHKLYGSDSDSNVNKQKFGLNAFNRNLRLIKQKRKIK